MTAARGARPGLLRRLEAGLLLPLGLALKPLPVPARIAIGSAIGRAGYLLAARRRRLAIENVRRALGLDPREARRVARRAFRHFGRVFVECVTLPSYATERAARRFDVEGFEHFLRAHERGRGVIVFSAHFGNWELAAMRQAVAGYPMDFIARPLDNPWLERAFTRWRELAGNRVLGKRGVLRRSLAGLRSGRSLAILIDQNVNAPPRLFLPFLGRPASVTPTLGHLAVRVGPPVVPLVTYAEPRGRYRIVYGPELTVPQEGSMEERVDAVTREALALIEGWIRARPEQWLWLHDRWKSGPADEEAPGS